MVRLMIRVFLGIFVLVAAGFIVISTDALAQEPPDPSLNADTPPRVSIYYPPSGFTTDLGAPLMVFSVASDAVGVSRVDLHVDGVLIRSDTAPDGVPRTEWALLQPWQPEQAGDFTLAVTAYRSDGTAGEPAAIRVRLTGSGTIPETGAEPQECIATVLTTLNVRQGPGVVYPVDGEVWLGQQARVTGRDAGGVWWQIDAGGRLGWISAAHTFTEGPCEEIAEAAAPPPPEGSAPVFQTPVPIYTPPYGYPPPVGYPPVFTGYPPPYPPPGEQYPPPEGYPPPAGYPPPGGGASTPTYPPPEYGHPYP